MKLAVAGALAASLALPALAPRPSGPRDQDKPAAVHLGAANIDRLAKLLHGYIGDIDSHNSKAQRKSLDKLIDDSGKVAKALKIPDALVAVEDWREIFRRGLALDKPPVPVNAYGRADFREVTIDDLPIDPNADAKELKDVFDRKLRVLVSVPVDHAKVAYPVLLVLHPSEAEENKGLGSMKKWKEIVDGAKTWAAGTYSKEVLSKAIVVVPILDCVKRNQDGVSFSRPTWNSSDGVLWAMTALKDLVLTSINYDPARLFIDGSGSGAAAAVKFCTWFPGLQAGAIVRGAPPAAEEIEKTFVNAAGTPFLLVGGEAKALGDRFSSDPQYKFTTKETLDDATLVSFITDHPKTFAPNRIKIVANDIRFAAGYWIRVMYEDSSIEKTPIELEAVADREKNEISVVTNKRVTQFEVFLNDEVLDLSREVRILHRCSDEPGDPKERFRGILKRGLQDAIEESYNGTFCNMGEVYFASKVIEVG